MKQLGTRLGTRLVLHTENKRDSKHSKASTNAEVKATHFSLTNNCGL